jgi:hypothetical protein
MILPDGLIFNRNRLDENVFFINDFFLKYEMSWTFVIKAFANYPNDFIREISNLECKSIATENENHLKIIKQLNPKIETWFLNYAAKKVNSNFIDVNLTHSTKQALDKACLMLNIDSDRYGAEYNSSLGCEKYGAYLDCSKPPKSDFFDAWKRLKIDPNKIQSLGTSITFESIDFLKNKGVNHYRLGEIILTGKSLINGEKLKGLRDDVFTSHKKITYHIISLNL